MALRWQKEASEVMAHILIADDDAILAMNIEAWLTREQHIVDCASDGAQTWELLLRSSFDLLILDWNMPKLTGLEIVERFRNAGGMTPILILTGKNSIAEKEQGLEAGADDYLTKPFDFKELSARVRALLRRPPVITGQTLQAKDITIDLNTFKVTKSGHPVVLQPLEFAVLEYLVRHPNQVFSPDALLNKLWDSEVSTDALYTCIRRLRKKIDPDATLIKNVPCVGYKVEI